MRVLIVEDEPYLAEAIRDGLRVAAIAADIAGGGDSALELLSINTYDVPGPSGDEIAKRIVASGSGMPVLMVTAADRLDDKASGFELGADDYPVTREGRVDRRPGLSVRLKLTVSYAGFLMVAAALLIGVVSALLVRYLPDVAVIPGGVLIRSDVLRMFALAVAYALAFLLVFGLLGGFSLVACSPR